MKMYNLFFLSNLSCTKGKKSKKTNKQKKDLPTCKWIRHLDLYLPVTLVQVVQALRVGLLADIGLEDNEVLASSLFSQQHTWVVTS